MSATQTMSRFLNNIRYNGGMQEYMMILLLVFIIVLVLYGMYTIVRLNIESDKYGVRTPIYNLENDAKSTLV